MDLVLNCDPLTAGAYDPGSQYWGAKIPQTTLILPQPDHDSLYYIFHTTAETRLDSLYTAYGQTFTHRYRLIYGKLYVTIVNTNRNGNLGEAVTNNELVIDDSIATGLLTACRHANGRDWWLLIPRIESNEFYTLLLTPDGVENMGIQQIGSTVYHGFGGQAKFSPAGTIYARYEALGNVNGNVTAGKGGYINIYKFDRATGQLSDQQFVPIYLCSLEGGIEFSPNSKYLYATYFDKVYQYDALAADIESTEVVVAQTEVIDMGTFNFTTRFRWMERGPDNKIYINQGGVSRWLHIIHQPDLQGAACDFEPLGLESTVSFNPCLPHFPNFLLGEATSNGIAIQEENLLKIVPNPSTGEFTIHVENDIVIDKVEIFSFEGQKLLEVSLSESSFGQVITPDLANGHYLCKISTSSGLQVERIVISR